MRIAETEIRAKADELAALSSEVSMINLKIADLKGYFQRLATEQLMNKKLKTIEYWGNQNVKITVSNSGTVKLNAPSNIKELFGDNIKEYIKEETNTSYTMTSQCKQLLGLVYQGEYEEGSLDEIIRQISSDIKIQKVLKKKLNGKGRFLKDKQTLMNIAGLSEDDASEWAYLAAEDINWEWLTQILKSSNWNGSTQEAIDKIKAAVIVEEGIKVAVNSDN